MEETKKTSKPRTKKAAPKKKEVIEFDLRKKYDVECIKEGSTLIKGKTYNVTGEIAGILHKKGLIKVL
jgi:hypothetical protein